MYIKECLLSDWTEASINKTFTFYDSFSFVDRLTSKKLNFKDVRKNSESLISSSKNNINLNSRKSQKSELMKSNLSIYKKTKQFQLKALKQKIFKKNQDDLNVNQQDISADQIRYSIKYKKRMRNLIDKSVQSLNRRQFKKIAKQSQSCHVDSQIIQINKSLKRTKTSLNMRTMNSIIKYQENYDNKIQQQQFKLKQEYVNKKQCKQNALNNDQFKSQQSQNFFQKMMTHAKNQIFSQGQYLVVPSNQKKKNDILLRKCKKPLGFFNSFKKDFKNDFSDLEKYSFTKLNQTNLIKQLKKQKNLKNRLSNQQNQQDKIYQNTIIKLVKQHYASYLNIELEIDNRALSAKDSKNNNLLHLCVKYKNYEALKLIFKKTEKKKLIKLLEEKNSYKKTPKRLAQILVDKISLQIFSKFQKQIKNTYFFD